jgi:6-phosphogluconate dehydrogenase
VFREWNQGELESYLIQITADVLDHVDPVTGQPFVDIVADRAEQKGTGRWTVQIALDLGVPVTGIAEAVFARTMSALTDQRAAARSLPGPDATPVAVSHDLVSDVRHALYASKLVAYAQGFDQIAAAGPEYGWDIDRSVVANIWRGGCIIRARFLNSLHTAYRTHRRRQRSSPTLSSCKALVRAQEPWRRVVATGAAFGVPTPGSRRPWRTTTDCAANGCPPRSSRGCATTSARHTYARVDRPGTFHTDWSGTAQEHQADDA